MENLHHHSHRRKRAKDLDQYCARVQYVGRGARSALPVCNGVGCVRCSVAPAREPGPPSDASQPSRAERERQISTMATEFVGLMEAMREYKLAYDRIGDKKTTSAGGQRSRN